MQAKRAHRRLCLVGGRASNFYSSGMDSLAQHLNWPVRPFNLNRDRKVVAADQPSTGGFFHANRVGVRVPGSSSTGFGHVPPAVFAFAPAMRKDYSVR